MQIIENITIEKAKEIITKDYPELNIFKVVLINNGWDNVVFEINEEYIFRFPREFSESASKFDKKRFYREINILNFLKNKTTLKIPQVDFIWKELFYMWYKKVQWGDLKKEIYDELDFDSKNKLIYDLALFFKEIHTKIDLENANILQIEKVNYDWIFNINKEIYKNIDDEKVVNFINLTFQELKEVILNWNLKEVCLHNDLHEWNMAFDYENQKLNWVFDFWDVLIWDVNMDFMSFYCYFDYDFLMKIMLKYEELSWIKLNLNYIILFSKIKKIERLLRNSNNKSWKVYRESLDFIQTFLK